MSSPKPTFTPLSTTLSRGVVQQPLAAADEITFPSLTEAGPHTDAYQTETATGLVLASEVEPHSISSASTIVAHDLEKGDTKEDNVKLVTFLENDTENPRNFGIVRKWRATLFATLLCFNSGFASSIITGGLNEARAEFGVSGDIINLTVCLFVVGFGFGPLGFAPASELYGRRIIYLISMALFCIFTIPCAVAKNVETLIVCRLIAGLAAAAPMCNAVGTIADVWVIEDRGIKMAAFSSILFASPCLGPIVGGAIVTAGVSWRWIYWTLLIFSIVCWLICFVWLEETYAPTLLRRRAIKMRKETGDDTIMTEQEHRRRPAGEVAREALLLPLVLLFTEPTMIFFSAYLCLIYGLLYSFFFAYPIVFEGGHGFNSLEVGLTFLSILIGIAFVGGIVTPYFDRRYRKLVVLGGGATVPESRLPMMMVCAVLLPISLFIFAFTSSPNTHWAGALVSGIPFGVALVGIYISANSYLADAYSSCPASAMASKTFIRSLAGASAPMWVPYLYKGAGNEWGGAVFAFVALGMLPIPFVFYIRGASIRARSKICS